MTQGPGLVDGKCALTKPIFCVLHIWNYKKRLAGPSWIARFYAEEKTEKKKKRKKGKKKKKKKKYNQSTCILSSPNLTHVLTE